MKKRLAIIIGLPFVVVMAFLAGSIFWRIHLLQGMNPEGMYFDSDGVRIHYNIAGAGVPVILVHGLAVNAGINFGARGVVAALAQDYQVITLDNRGHGRSDKPHDPNQYGVKMCEDVIRLMDHLDIGKAHVLGYSMGGFIVLKLAILHPDRLLSFMPCASGWTPEPEKEMGFFLEMADSLEKDGNYAALSDKLTPIGKKVSRRNRIIMSYGLSFINDNKAIAALLRAMPELVVEEAALRANTLPALALVGERDPLRVFTEQMAAVTSNMKLVIVPDGDHMSTLRREAAITAIKTHLNENTPSGTAPTEN